MNKFKGSSLMRVISWILTTISAIGLVLSFMVFVVLEEEGIFSKTIYDKFDEAYEEITQSYANKAVYESVANDKAYDLSKDGVKYAIITKSDFEQKKYDNVLYTTLDKESDIRNLKPVVVDYFPNGFLDDNNRIIYTSYSTVKVNSYEQTKYCPAIVISVPTGLFYYADNEGKYYLSKEVVLRLATHEKTYNLPNEGIIITDGEVTEDYEEHSFEHYEDGGYILFEQWDDVLDLVYDDERGCYINVENGNEVNPYDYYEVWDSVYFNHAWSKPADGIIIRSEDQYFEKAAVNNVNAYLDSKGVLRVSYDVDPTEYVVLTLVDENYWNHTKIKFADIWHNFLLENKTISEYRFADNAIMYMYRVKNGVLAVGIGCFMVMLLTLIYLFSAAGHRKNKEEIVLTVFDRMPFDVFTVFMSIAWGLCIALLTEVVNENMSMYVTINLGIIAAVLAWIITLWYLLSIAVRIKNKNLFKNSIIYKVLHFCWKTIKKACKWIVNLIKQLASYISTFWIIAISFGVLVIIEIAAMSTKSAGIFFISLLLQIAALTGIFKLLYDYRKLAKAAKCISDGNLEYKVVTEKMYKEEKELGESLNNIADGLNKAVEGRMKSERMKTELITNVSHDIKTPLTSIVNYVDLLKKEETDNENIKEYTKVLERQASRLKKLIEDLVEASKASTGNLAVNIETIDASVMISQVAGEFEEKLQQNELELIVRKPEPPVEIKADGRHLWRVMDNLINNICKYAQPNSRVYIDLEQNDTNVKIIMRNISKYQLNMEADELLERFVRGDESRNTEGHGLGLSIAKSLMNLMGGTLDIVIDGDLFKVILTLSK